MVHNMPLDIRITCTSGRRDRRANSKSVVAVAIFLIAVAPLVRGEQNAPRNDNVPDEVNRCLKMLAPGFALSARINPFYLRGDFYGDGKASYAVLVHNSNQQGIMMCRTTTARPNLYLQSGSTRHCSRCHVSVARFPQPGQNRDLQVWQIVFVSESDA